MDPMRRLAPTRFIPLVLALAALPLAAQTGNVAPVAAPAKPAFRVCGDPDNLPFSNAKGEGFENRIAELIAAELGDTVTYTWWPQRRGFVRNTLRAKECDVLIGVPAGFDPVAETKPYYRSTYYIVTRADRKLGIKSLDDEKLRGLKVGVNVIGEDYTNTPPAHALGLRGITAVGFDTFYNAEHRPDDIIKAVASGKIDAAVVWGPLAGYFAKRSPTPLSLVALPDSVDRTGYPFAYDIGMGVRRADKALKAQLDTILERKRPEIQRILDEYGVPKLAPTAAR
jgi:quinoprotein dehydrogenase-associated probable ABC transporter substrate-binding protein